MRRAGYLLLHLPLLILSPLLILIPSAAIAISDLLWSIFGRRKLPPDAMPNCASASVVIPNWNGRDLLERYLPSVIKAMAGHPDNEVIVVDNASSDGSAELVKRRFPSVRVIELPTNLGFGGGSNTGFRAATNDIVVLLNSDMRVEPGFLQPLLDGSPMNLCLRFPARSSLVIRRNFAKKPVSHKLGGRGGIFV